MSRRQVRFGNTARLFMRVLNRFFRKKGYLLFYCVASKPFCGNLRALCDAAAKAHSVKRIYILNYGVTPDAEIRAMYNDADKVKIISDSYWHAFTAALVSDIAFFTEYGNKKFPNFSVNLWHGIPLKKIGIFQKSRPKKSIPKRYRKYITDRLIASSTHDLVVMSACFGMPPEYIYNTGLPRNDWLDPQVKLPADLARQALDLHKVLRGKKLLLYAPTFRDENRSWLPLREDQLSQLGQFLEKHGFMLGIRPHVTVHNFDFNGIPNAIDCSANQFPEIHVLLRETEILMTDYSSCALDFMLLKRPIVSYAPDLNEYSRGFLYDFHEVFPGLVTRTFDELKQVLLDILADGPMRAKALEKAEVVRHLFHERRERPISEVLLDAVLNDPLR